jgi:DNA-binding NtrC family response regulator
MQNSIMRAAVLAHGPAISAEHLSFASSSRSRPESDGKRSGQEDDSLATVERIQVQRVLQKTGGNKRRAAKILGVSRPRLDRLIERHGLMVPES